MNSLSVIVLCFAFTYVNCMTCGGNGGSRSNPLITDLDCLQKGMNAIDRKTDDEIYNMTQQALGGGFGRAMGRANVAAQVGYTCYNESYSYLAGQLGPVLVGPGEMNLLAKAKSAKERSDAIKGIYEYSMVVKCDEDWRANTFPKQLNDSVCTKSDQDQYKKYEDEYLAKLKVLNDPEFANKMVSSESNAVVADLMKTRMSTYQTMFNNALTCCQGMSPLAEQCKCIRLQSYELDRLFYMLSYPKLLPQLQQQQRPVLPQQRPVLPQQRPLFWRGF